jgi:hypothetical protein
MADITMCSGEGCPLKQICYRHTAKPSELQSYFAQPPVLGGTCEHFWRTEVRAMADITNGITNGIRAEVSAKTDENDEKSTDKLTK